jgi:hypothetical protein
MIHREGSPTASPEAETCEIHALAQGFRHVSQGEGEATACLRKVDAYSLLTLPRMNPGDSQANGLAGWLHASPPLTA